VVGDYVESKREIAREATVKDAQGVVERRQRMKREEARRAVDGSVVVVLGSGVGPGGLL
jgi:hypothetical protein